jgi:hypothetical protein
MRSSQGKRDVVSRVISVMILVIICNNTAVSNIRTASTVYSSEVILPIYTLKKIYKENIQNYNFTCGFV